MDKPNSNLSIGRTQRTWLAEFTGRANSAIGITHKIQTTVKGETKEKARLALYDRFEHISQLTLKNV